MYREFVRVRTCVSRIHSLVTNSRLFLSYPTKVQAHPSPKRGGRREKPFLPPACPLPDWKRLLKCPCFSPLFPTLFPSSFHRQTFSYEVNLSALKKNVATRREKILFHHPLLLFCTQQSTEAMTL